MRKLLPLLFLISMQAFSQVDNNLKNSILSNQTALQASQVTNIQWDEIEPYVNGFARALSGVKFTFLDQNGKAISPIIFDGARNFSNGLVAVQQSEHWGFMDGTGKLVVPCNYDLVFDFKWSQTIASKGNNWYFINKKNQVTKLVGIEHCSGFQNGAFVVRKNGVEGMLSMNGSFTPNANQPTLVNSSATASRTSNPGVNNATSAACPNNLDFENGNFTDWRCYTGTVDSVGNTNVITVAPSAPMNNRHRIITRATPSQIDPFALFPTNPPDGSNFCVRLGNTNIGAQAERIRYTVRVPINDSNFAIKYNYAVVFQDPSHTTWSQPRFVARIFDSSANAYIDCASFEYISTSNLPGFAVSNVDTSVIFKPWSSVFLGLGAYAGKTLYLEFTTADCVRRGHWGYAYVDVESACGQAVSVGYDCAPPHLTTLDAPPGFQTYTWWNQNYTSIVASGEHAVLNPGPANATTLMLEMIPYNGFGCRDTMTVQLSGGLDPDFHASTTESYCAPHQIVFYNHNIPALSATWNFGDGTTATGDTVTHTYTNPGTYIVTMTVTLANGCTGSKSDTVVIHNSTASWNYNGGLFCNPTTSSWTVNAPEATRFEWNFGDGQTSTTTTPTANHLYGNSGTYQPSVLVHFPGGCNITLQGNAPIVVENFTPSFTYTIQSSCGSSMVQFTNTTASTASFLQAIWHFGDGTTATGNAVSHTYTTSGVKLVKIVVYGVNGCIDSVVRAVQPNVMIVPTGNISGPNSACLGDTLTFQHGYQTLDSVVSLVWTVSNGYMSNASSPSFTFNQPGNYQIQLVATSIHGCKDTLVKNIIIHDLPIITSIQNQNLCNGVRSYSVTWNSNLSNTQYIWYNDNSSIGLGSTGIGDVPAFTAINNTNNAVFANITVTATANGCSVSQPAYAYAVNPVPAAVQAADQIICNRQSTSPIIFNNVTSAVASNDFAWTNNQPGIGLPTSGNGNIPTFIGINNTNAPITATIQIVPTISGCPGPASSFTITINPTPVLDPLPNQTLCSGNATAAIAFHGATGADQYVWSNNDSTIGLPVSGIGNIGTFQTINTTSQTLTAQISVLPILNGCYGNTQNFAITVHPTPAMNAVNNQQVCAGTFTQPISFQGTIPGTSYAWTNSNANIGLASSGLGAIPAFQTTNNSANLMSATVVVTPTYNGCPGPARTFQLQASPLADFAQPNNLSVCSGQSAAGTVFQSNVPGIVYQWTNNNPNIGLAAQGTGNIPSFTTPGNSLVRETATITVSSIANGCPGTDKIFTISIDPVPTMVQPGNLTACAGTTISATNFQTNLSGTNFTWTSSTNSIGLPSNGVGAIPAFIAVNNGTNTVTATITVFAEALGCRSAAVAFEIHVDPLPLLEPIANKQVCAGKLTDSAIFNSNGSGVMYQWTSNNTQIGLGASGTGAINPFVGINNGSQPIQATVTVLTTNAQQCRSLPQQFSIVINPLPQLNAGNDVTVCKGSNALISATGANAYQWFPATGLSCTNCPAPTAIINDTMVYNVIGTNTYGCEKTAIVRVNVIPPVDMLISPNDTLCAGGNVQLFAQGATRYEWFPATGLDNPTSSSPIATPTVSTRYRVIGYSANRCFADTGYIYVEVAPIPLVNAGSDVEGPTGSTVNLSATVQGTVNSYNWIPATGLSCTDCPNPVLIISSNTTYELTVKNRYGCVAKDSLRVITFCKSSEVFVANAFTPDGDGINDVLVVRGMGINVKTFRVFNRWGNLVFEKLNFAPNDPANGWDGKVKGVKAAPDVYVYIAEVTCDNGTVYFHKGNTTLLK
jgi:gliding motility-associated-like protein